MRQLYLKSFKKNGIIFFPDELIDNLGISKDCLLYGAILGEGEAVFSMIPFQYWTQAYKINIYTNDAIGSLKKICDILVKEFNILFLTTWSSSIDRKGSLCFTAIATFHNEGKNEESRIKAIENLLNEKRFLLMEDVKEVFEDLTNCKSLIDGKIYGKDAGKLSPIKITKLLVLDKFGELIKKKNKTESSANIPYYKVNVENYVFNLNKLENSRHSPNISFYNKLKNSTHFNFEPKYYFLNPDSEERYFIMTLIDPEVSLKQIKWKITQESNSLENFKGLTLSILNTLQKTGHNIYYSNDVAVESSEHETNEGLTAIEKSTFEYIVDNSRYNLKAYESEPNKEEVPQNLKDAIVYDLKKSIEEEKESKKVTRRFRVSEFKINNIEDQNPCIFLATNYHENMIPDNQPMQEAQKEIIRKVYSIIRSLNLKPINIDIAVMQWLQFEAQKTLKCCPFLVSVHLADTARELKNQNNEIKYACSDWVLFEESYMQSLNRRVFRLRSNKVGWINNSLGQREYVFNTDKKDNVEECIESFHKSVKRYLQTKHFDSSLLKAETFAEKMLDKSILSRELDDLFFSEIY